MSAAALRLFEADAGVAWRRRGAMMLRIRIERWDTRRDGPLSEAALAEKIEAFGYAVAPKDYPASAPAPAESENRQRVHAVVRGLIKITIDGDSAILGAGDVAFIPRGAVRRVEVIGTVPARCLEAVSRDDAA